MTEASADTPRDDERARERALVLRAQTGDRVAFEELVRRSARGLFARLYLDTGDRDRAEDLVQETFLVAWRSLGQVTDPDGWRSWLASIAASVKIDAARRAARKKRAGPRTDPDALTSVPARSAGPPQQAEQAEARQRLLDTLRTLPSDYQQVLTLRYLAGFDYDAIGRQLGLTNGSLRGLLNRGMTMLRERMQDPEQHATPPV